MLNKFIISTESFHKYLVTLGSVLFIFCLTVFSLSEVTLMEKKMSYKINYAELADRGPSEGVSINHSTEVIAFLDTLESTVRTTIFLSFYGAIASGVMMFIGMCIWAARQSNDNMLLKLKVDEAKLKNMLLKKEVGLDVDKDI